MAEKEYGRITDSFISDLQNYLPIQFVGLLQVVHFYLTLIDR